MHIRNFLLYYVFAKLTVTSTECQLIPTFNIEQFRTLFPSTSWKQMFGNASNITPGYGEIVLGVRSTTSGNFIGFIRILFAEENSNNAEFHCGFHFETFADKRVAVIGSLLSLKLYLSMINTYPTSKVRKTNVSAINWSKKLGFTSTNEIGQYVYLSHHGNVKTVDVFLKRLGISHIKCVGSNLTVNVVQKLLTMIQALKIT